MRGHGLSAKHLGLIKRILASQCGDIQQVALFGSRATGAFQPHSDVDLVLYGDINEQVVDRLWTRFCESMLPYKVDLTAYGQVTYPPLKRHIDEVARVLFTREELYQS